MTSTVNSFALKEFTPYLLNRAAEAISLRFESAYRERYGMLRTEWRVLAHLGEFGAMTARDICTASGEHKTKISRAISALEQKRFVLRHRQEDDRRFETLHMTDAGRSAFDDISSRAVLFDEELRAGFGGGEVDRLKQTLKNLTFV